MIEIKNHDVAVFKDLAEGGCVGLPAKDDEVAILIGPTQVGVTTAGDVNRAVLVLHSEVPLIVAGEELVFTTPQGAAKKHENGKA